MDNKLCSECKWCRIPFFAGEIGAKCLNPNVPANKNGAEILVSGLNKRTAIYCSHARNLLHNSLNVIIKYFPKKLLTA